MWLITYNMWVTMNKASSVTMHHVTTCFNNHYEFISIYRFNLTVPYLRKILSAQFPSTLAWFWLCIWRMKYKVQYTSTYSTFNELSSLGLIQPFWNDTKLILVALLSLYKHGQQKANIVTRTVGNINRFTGLVYSF